MRVEVQVKAEKGEEAESIADDLTDDGNRADNR